MGCDRHPDYKLAFYLDVQSLKPADVNNFYYVKCIEKNVKGRERSILLTINPYLLFNPILNPPKQVDSCATS